MKIVEKFTNQKCIGYTKDLVAIVESHVIFTDGATGVVWQVGLDSEITDVRPYICYLVLGIPNLTTTNVLVLDESNEISNLTPTPDAAKL